MSPAGGFQSTLSGASKISIEDLTISLPIYEFLEMQQNPQTLLQRLLDRKGSVRRLPWKESMLGRLLRYQLLLKGIIIVSYEQFLPGAKAES